MPRCLDDMPWRSLKGLGNLAPKLLHVGDFKNEQLKNGVDVQFRLIGLNHDVTENGTILPMTWEMIECLPERYRWNNNDTTRGSWAGTKLCQSMNNPDGEIYQLLPDEIISLAESVVKLTANTYDGSNSIIESVHKFWIKSEKETYGRCFYSAPGEGKWYEYYRQEDVPWSKKRNGAEENCSLRSPCEGSDYSFCGVSANGTATNHYASYSVGVAPAFSF